MALLDAAADPGLHARGRVDLMPEIDSFSDEAWRYGFRWGPLVVERTAHIEGRGYVVTIQTERESMQVYVSEKGRRMRAYEPVPR